MLIGAVVRDFSDPFFAGAIEALAVEAMGHGYNVVLGHAQGRLDESIALTTVLETRHTDAIVLLGDMQDQPRLMDDLRGSTVPVVAMWQGTSPLEFPTAEPDDRAGILAGLTHVAELGHRKIALRQRASAGRLPPARGRLRRIHGPTGSAGCRTATSAGSPNTMAGGEAVLRDLLALPEPPTAVGTSTDLVAIGVLHAAHEVGATVPDRLSVVGFDDILIAAHTVPALTTVRMPITEMVRDAVSKAIAGRADPDAAGVRRPRSCSSLSLVVRESTAPPPT